MDRRKALKTSALMLGYAVSATTTAAILGGCKADPDPMWSPKYLDMIDAKTIDKLSSLILPSTDTPGANEAMVGRYIDGFLQVFADDTDKSSVKGFLSSLEQKTQKDHGKSFTKLPEETQIDIINSLLTEDDKGMKKIREWTITGFCTSEVGAKGVLVYDPIPASQKGCIPLADVGGIWYL